MSIELEIKKQDNTDIITSLVLNGDISKLSAEQRVVYYRKFCESVGLNPLTQPFQILKLQGKEVLYANKTASEQLRKINNISIVDLQTKIEHETIICTCAVQEKEGRKDFATGAVSIKGLQGDALANAIMKAETKSKRRATLSICGLGILDETELETIPAHEKVNSNFENDNRIKIYNYFKKLLEEGRITKDKIESITNKLYGKRHANELNIDELSSVEKEVTKDISTMLDDSDIPI